MNFGHDKHDTGDTAHYKLNYLDFILKVIKGHKVNWNTIYDLLYVFHINFGHDKHDTGDTAHYKLNCLDFILKVIKGHKVN